ncbi:MAG: hypothetical protein J7647_08945 [Cyanobacteria bacterium SBLK]|nr:hypothetical protein [Cyanobacteria bacterium SBLK]
MSHLSPFILHVPQNTPLPLYRQLPSEAAIAARIDRYYRPYRDRLQALLLKSTL